MIAGITSELLSALGVDLPKTSGVTLAARSPIDGSVLGQVAVAAPADIERAIATAHAGFLAWRNEPAPRRGELVRLFGEELRANKSRLGRLVSIESGKIAAEGEGEVQEMIDICDFAVGLSRQLYGLTIASERAGHRMMESWHPLGVVGVISAFNFPVAVWAWNAALALVCGNAVVWKPSEKTPLVALAVQSLFSRAAQRFDGGVAATLSQVLNGDAAVGQHLVDDVRIALVSATGSTRMGRAVAQRVAARLGRSLLELGGNNAIVVAPTADLDLATRAVVFAAVGTAGQRCTTARRLIVHNSVHEPLLRRLAGIYASLPVGNPLDAATLVGPLIDRVAFDAMQSTLVEAREQGAVVSGGERVHAERYPAAYYVRPAIAQLAEQTAVACRETFAPILYALRYDSLDEAIALNNGVSQGLSSAIFTNDLREAERFLSARGSDCGIANVNIGTSGAEIGGAFGGEKDTGGGRESGSDCWRNYMRRATNTINYSGALPLAQGVRFDV